MKKITIYIYLLSFIVIGCDTFYLISLSKNSPELNINFECGELNMSLQNWQGHSFDFYQDFQLNDTLTIYKDSLHIYYKKKRYPTTFIKEGKGVLTDNKLELIGKSSIRTAFYIDLNVNEGDTIQVYPKGYLSCKEKEVRLDSLKIIIQQDLRGPFGK